MPNENITDEHRHRLGWLVEAAKKDELALFEVTDKEGKPAVLVVAFDRTDDGVGGRMAPLARIDMDFNEGFTPPEGVDKITSSDEDGVDNSGVGC